MRLRQNDTDPRSRDAMRHAMTMSELIERSDGTDGCHSPQLTNFPKFAESSIADVIPMTFSTPCGAIHNNQVTTRQ
jgi:hypothetical protein